jgi:hypothetical protein
MGPINVADHPEVPVFRYPRGRALAALTLALGLVTAPAHAQDYPRLGLHVQLYQNGFPMITGNDVGGPFDTSVLDAIARYDEVTFGASPASEYRPDLVAQLRTRHPGIHVIGYVMAENIYLGPNTPDSLVNLPTRIRRLVRDDGAWLYNRSGGIYSFVNINFAKRDGSGRYTVAEDLANLFADVVGTTGVWDGMFFDYFCDGVLWSQTPAESIDVVRAGYTTQTAFDAAWLAGSQAFANRMRTRVGPNFVLIGNCGLGTKYSTMNGWMRENFPNQNGGTWASNMTAPDGMISDRQFYTSAARPMSVLSVACNPFDPYAARLGLASSCLADGAFVVGPSNFDPTIDYRDWWLPEMEPGWLGQALGPANGIGGVWTRNFERGSVTCSATGWAFTRK